MVQVPKAGRPSLPSRDPVAWGQGQSAKGVCSQAGDRERLVGQAASQASSALPAPPPPQVNHLRCLHEFVESQTTYYAQCYRHMLDLQKQLGRCPLGSPGSQAPRAAHPLLPLGKDLLPRLSKPPDSQGGLEGP